MHGYAKYILTIEGLKGSPHSVTIPVITFSYGPKGSVSTGGYGSSSHGGRRTGDPDSVFAERAMDKYSPQIELANRIGSHLDKVTATLEEYHESDDKSTLAGRLIVTLSDVVVETYMPRGGSGRSPTESITFTGAASAMTHD